MPPQPMEQPGQREAFLSHKVGARSHGTALYGVQRRPIQPFTQLQPTAPVGRSERFLQRPTGVVQR